MKKADPFGIKELTREIIDQEVKPLAEEVMMSRQIIDVVRSYLAAEKLRAGAGKLLIEDMEDLIEEYDSMPKYQDPSPKKVKTDRASS